MHTRLQPSARPHARFIVCLLAACGAQRLAAAALARLPHATHHRLSPRLPSSSSSSSRAAIQTPLMTLSPSHPARFLAAAASAPATTSVVGVRPAVVTIASVVGACLLLTIPCGLKALLSSSSRRTLHRRLFTGFLMGAVVSAWIFSGTWAFLAIFAGLAIVGQTEYYNMARGKGEYPTWKLGTLGSVGMYIAACSANPLLRDALFPLTGTVTIVYLLLRQERRTPPTTINDISSTFMGIFYFGYMPSFWVRLRCLGHVPTADFLQSVLAPDSAMWSWPVVRALASSSADFFTWGALVQWWTMFSIVTADVAAYFAGKRFGRTPLISVSPNKTWEGFVGGCAACMAVFSAGASLMRWPRPWLYGPCYGLMIAVMALIGDLVVSLIKRSAGVKDTGDLLPGHGGLLDRLDSYLLVAAPAYFFVLFLLRHWCW